MINKEMSINQGRSLFEMVSPDGNNVLSTEGVKQSLLYIQRTPALSFEIQRGVQPIFSSKSVIPNTPMNPRQPIKNKYTKGYQPTQLKYVKTPTTVFKLPQMLTPQTIVEGQNVVYSDGVPKLNTQGQSAVYDELTKNAYRKQIDELRQRGKDREADSIEQKHFPEQHQIGLLQNQINELVGLGRGVGNLRVDADTHRIIAERQRQDILDELARLRGSGRVTGGPTGGPPRLSAMADLFYNDVFKKVKGSDNPDEKAYMDLIENQITSGRNYKDIISGIEEVLNVAYPNFTTDAGQRTARNRAYLFALYSEKLGRPPTSVEVDTLLTKIQGPPKRGPGRPITSYRTFRERFDKYTKIKM